MMSQDKGLIHTVKRTLQSNWLFALLVVFLVLLPHIVGWITGDSPFGVGGRPRGQSIFWQGILIETFILAILTMSYNLMFGFSGVVSFGHALFFGLGGYTLGIIIQMSGIESAEWAFTLGIVAALFLSGTVGFLMGIASLRLKGVYFAIFSLAIAEMAFIWVGRWSLTNAEDGFPLSDLPFNPLKNRLNFYYVALMGFIFVFLMIRRLMNSPTGHVLLAVRENEDRAQAIGYNTLTYKLLAITLASMIAAGSGMLYAVFNAKVGPESMSVQYTIDPLLMTIIGGTGTFAGPVVGSAGLQLSERILNREFDIAGTIINVGEHWSLILGLIFVFVVLLFPQGIVGSYYNWREKRKRKPLEIK